MTDPAGGRDVELRKIWAPLQIGGVTVKNRIAMPAMSTYYGEGERFITDRHIAYYRERAYGGVGLIVTEQQLADSRTGFRSNCLIAWDERAIPGLMAAGNAVHEHGAKLFVQLLAPGAWDTGLSSLEDWHVARGPSRMYIDYLGQYVDELTRTDIKKLAVDFARSAVNVRRAGLDGVEIHGAHGYIAQQFMSRALNKRSDEYGGSPANRSRFVIEAGQAIRDMVGDDLAVGIRLSIEEFKGDAGVTEAEMLEMIDIIAEHHVYDFFDISCGGFGAVHRTIAPMGIADGFLAPQGKHVKEVVGARAKVFLAGRIRDLEMAERIVADGAADMVHMGRAHIADPLLVRKTLEGQKDEVIRCIGVNGCAGGQPMVNCILNPITGRERQWGAGSLKVGTHSKRVVVVGGGPAGLKFAGVAAARGHKVVLVEQRGELGGMLNEFKVLPTRGDWQIAIDDFAWIATKRGVEFRLGAKATPDYLDAERADVVVCATGANWTTDAGAWVRDLEDGPDGPRVVDVGAAVREAVTSPSALGRRVIVIDETGGYLPLGLAELITAAGSQVHFVTSRAPAGQNVSVFDAPYLFPRLASAGVELVLQSRVTNVKGTDVTIESIWGGHERQTAKVDTIVMSLPKTPSDKLFKAIEGKFAEVFLIGDAIAPRTVRDAVFEGEKLGRQL